MRRDPESEILAADQRTTYNLQPFAPKYPSIKISINQYIHHIYQSAPKYDLELELYDFPSDQPTIVFSSKQPVGPDCQALSGHS